MRLRLLLAFVASAFVCTISAPAADFQVPPAPDRYVTDSAGALSASAHAAVETQLQAFEKATGHQVIVYIANTTGNVPLETWTVEAANQWKVGRKGLEDGAILFLFMQDHKVRIEVGYGLESKLTDADSNRIITDDIVPRMKAGDVDGAVTSGVADMLTTIAPAYKTALPTSTPVPSSSGGPIAVILGVIFILFILFGIFLFIVRVIGIIRYGFLVMREGSTAARRDMRNWWFFGSGFAAGSVLGGDWGGSSGGGGGGFSGGGGSFGGGGASGSW